MTSKIMEIAKTKEYKERFGPDDNDTGEEEEYEDWDDMVQARRMRICNSFPFVK